MAHTLAIGEMMVAAAARSRGTLGVNYNYRCVPSHGVIKSELERGAFGEPALFTAYVHSYLWAHMIDLMRFFFGDAAEVTAAVVDEQSKRPIATANAAIQWMHAAQMIYHPSVARYPPPSGFASQISLRHCLAPFSCRMRRISGRLESSAPAAHSQ